MIVVLDIVWQIIWIYIFPAQSHYLWYHTLHTAPRDIHIFIPLDWGSKKTHPMYIQYYFRYIRYCYICVVYTAKAFYLTSVEINESNARRSTKRNKLCISSSTLLFQHPRRKNIGESERNRLMMCAFAFDKEHFFISCQKI